MKNWTTHLVGKYRVIIFKACVVDTIPCSFCKEVKLTGARIYVNSESLRFECCFDCRNKYGLSTNICREVEKALVLLKMKGKL